MVLAYHLIITAYGFWLPNDPRGSWSDFVGAWELRRFGPATKTSSHRSLAARPHDVTLRLAAKKALKYPDVHFSAEQIQTLARAFGEWTSHNGVTLWACAVLPEHAHFVVARHRYKAEQIANLLKGESTRALVAAGQHPLAALVPPGHRPPKVSAQNQWTVFLDAPADIRRAIRYVENNPTKEGQSRQQWPWVTAYG